MSDVREYLAATRWTPAEWKGDRSGDWATAVRIGEPVKAGGQAKRRGGGEVIKPGLTTGERFGE